MGAAPSGAEEVAEPEEIAEDVGEVGEVTRIEAAGPAAAVDGGVAIAVVPGALLLVGEHLVRLGRFLEALLGRAVVRVLVRVVLHRQPAKSLLDVVHRGIALDAKDFVIVAFFCSGHS